MPKRKSTKRKNAQKRREYDRNVAIASLGLRYASEAKLEGVEVRHIKKVLAATDGNISLAADLLGMPRRTLQRIMRRWQRKTSPRRKHGRKCRGRR